MASVSGCPALAIDGTGSSTVAGRHRSPRIAASPAARTLLDATSPGSFLPVIPTVGTEADSPADRVSGSATRPTIDRTGRERTGWERSTFLWGLGCYFVILIPLVLASLRTAEGQLVYLIDDPAIHLSMADTLANHATWGVRAGEFQSASSSPLWTMLLTLWVKVLPGARDLGPLLLNIVSACAVVALFARRPVALLPSPVRRLDVGGLFVLIGILGFLPALTVLGMEHTLHAALVLALVGAALDRRTPPRSINPGRSIYPGWAVSFLLVLTVLTRFETLFVAAGLAVAHVVCSKGIWSPDHDREPGGSRRAAGRGAAILTITLLPVIAFATLNRAMGQGWLPNSVLAKGQAIGGGGPTFTPTEILGRLSRDPLLAGLAVGLICLLILTRGRTLNAAFPAITTVTAILLHVTLADVGWYERYQSYLILLGLWTALMASSELLPDSALPPVRSSVVPLLLATLLLLSGTKLDLTWKVPTGVADTYLQRYQAGRFFRTFYDQQPIATGELGYISLAHDGPITDLYGLADYEVLQARRAQGRRPSNAYWEQLQRDRGFRVVALYPTTLFDTTPPSWVFVGEWHIDRPVVTAWEPTFQFYAADPDEVAALEQHLTDFASSLPPGVRQTLNPLAGFRADAIKAERAAR